MKIEEKIRYQTRISFRGLGTCLWLVIFYLSTCLYWVFSLVQ